MYSHITNSIKVTVIPSYFEAMSDPLESKFIWSYKIKIENYGLSTVKLIKRYFHVIDQNGVKEIVAGEGVIDKKPVISPGKKFEYSSFILLRESSGVMMGNYYLADLDNNYEFLVQLPTVSLDKPGNLVMVN